MLQDATCVADDDKISPREFQLVMSKILWELREASRTGYTLKILFGYFDSDKDGNLTSTEFTQGFLRADYTGRS